MQPLSANNKLSKSHSLCNLKPKIIELNNLPPNTLKSHKHPQARQHKIPNLSQSPKSN
eukprot:gene3226-2208_t